MAASSIKRSCSFHCNSPLTPRNSASISATGFALSSCHSSFDGSNGISLKKAHSISTASAKFEKFQGEDVQPRPVIMRNLRLISEDDGVGINVRNLRQNFLGLWMVFYNDEQRPSRYLLAREFISRPNAEDIEIIFGNVEAKSEEGPPLFSQAATIFSSLNGFMKVISK